MGTSLNSVIRFLRKLAAPPAGAADTDGQLLQRFADERDEEAFALLMQRHGPMVLGVCQRLLHNLHDAEDAFQATFLLLVRKAHSLQRRESVGSWLYGVALRVAGEAKRSARRRLAHEREVPAMATTEPASDLVWRDLQPVLDEELGRLTEKYRAPFVLCHLEGRSVAEAALQLGCPKGTVLSRLSRARERLRFRLTRRGVILSTALLAEALAQNSLSATVSPALTASTLKVALMILAGNVALAGTISTQVTALMEGVIQTMFVTKLKIAAAVVLTLGVLGAGGAWTYGKIGSSEKGTEKENPAARSDPKPQPNVDDDKQVKPRPKKQPKDFKNLEDALVDVKKEEMRYEDMEQKWLGDVSRQRAEVVSAEEQLKALQRRHASASERELAEIKHWEEYLRRMREKGVTNPKTEMRPPPPPDVKELEAVHQKKEDQRTKELIEMRLQLIQFEERLKMLERRHAMQRDDMLRRIEDAKQRAREAEGATPQPDSSEGKLRELDRKLDKLLREISELRRELKKGEAEGSR